MWRAFPYFAWRYGERGRRFGRSDAGFLVTLLELDEATARAQVQWLAGVLAPRGMPSLLLEVQLESLGRAARRFRGSGAERFVALAGHLRARRSSVLEEATFADCETRTRLASHGITRRRGAGRLIAAAVADHALGLGDHAGALVRWLSDAEPADAAWRVACDDAHALAIRSAAATLAATESAAR